MQLGDRAIRVPWDERKRKDFAQAMERVQVLAVDSKTTSLSISI
jgi:hypothetical protein